MNENFIICSDAFFGPVCDYVIAPVARYAGVWGIPVLTAGAQAEAFRYKSEHYPTLTRMMGSHRLVGEALRHILVRFGWKIAGLLYHNHAMASSRGNSECHFTLGAVFTALGQTSVHKSFNQEMTTVEDYRDLLAFLAKSARSKFRLDKFRFFSPPKGFVKREYRLGIFISRIEIALFSFSLTVPKKKKN